MNRGIRGVCCTLVVLLLVVSLAGNFYFWRRSRQAPCGRPPRPLPQPSSAAPGRAPETAPEISVNPAPVEEVANENEAPVAVPGEVPAQEGVEKGGHLPLTIQRVKWESSGRYLVLKFSKCLDVNEKDVFLEPPLKDGFHCFSYGATVELGGEFEAGQLYVVTVKNGGESASAVVVGVDHPSSAKLGIRGEQFTLSSPRWAFPVNVENLKGNLSVSVYEPYENRLLSFLDNSWNRQYSRLVARTELPVKLEKNRRERVDLDLEKIGIPRKPGIYMLRIADSRGDSGDYSGEPTMVLVSDLGISATLFPQDAVVAVRSLQDQRVLPGARVRLYSEKQQLLGEAVTDGQGIARIPLTPLADKGDSPALILASLDGDRAFCNCYGTPENDGPMEAFLFPEREICRPGEELGVHAILRDAAGLAVSSAPMEFQLRDPRGQCVEKRVVAGDADGLYSLAWRISETAPLGLYQTRMGLPGKDDALETVFFQVGEALPDRVWVSLEGEVAGGESPRVKVSGRAEYYYGAPVAGGECKVSAACLYKAFSPKGYDEFFFGCGEARQCPATSGSAALATDGEGNFQGEIALSRLPDCVTAPVQVNITATCLPGGGQRGVTASRSILYHATECYVGAWKPSGDGQSECRVKLVGVTPRGQEVSLEGRGLSWKLFRQDWRYLLKEGRDGSLQRVWERQEALAQEGALLLQEGWLSFPERVAPGSYRLLVQDEQGRPRLDFTFWHEANEGGQRLKDPRRLVFELDREEYLPGQKAVLTFQSALPGQGVVAAGLRGAGQTLAFPVAAGENRVEVEIPEDLRKGAWFAVVTVACREDESSDPRLLEGVAKLPVRQEGRLLRVRLDAPGEAAPGETVELQATLANARSGAACSGRVLVWGVDEGILALTGYKTPDPFRGLYGDDQGEPWTVDSYGKLYPILNGGTEKTGGDGASALARFLAAKREKLPESALFCLGWLSAGEDGVARGRVTLPVFTGRLRLMAVAAGHDAVGSAESSLTMRRDATLTLSGPRAVAPGDILQISLQAANHRLPAGEAKWRVAVENGEVLSSSASEGSFSLGEKGVGRASLMVRAGSGEGHLRVTAELSAGGQVFREENTLVVRTPWPAVETTAFEILAPGEERVCLVGDFGSLEAGSPALAISGALQWLAQYPYGCLEQTVAAAFPLLAVRDLVHVGMLPEAYEASAADRIRQTIRDLAAKRCANGWFAMWDGAREPWLEGSLFAYLFLLEARERGFDFPVEWQASMEQNLRGLLNLTGEDPCLRALGNLVLVFANPRAGASYAGLLPDQHPDSFAVFLKAVCLLKGGRAAEGAVLLEKALANVDALEGTGSFAGLDSRVRRLGMGLWLLKQVAPGHVAIPALAQRLLQARGAGGHWGTTQENAWAALGLSQCLEPQAGKFAVSLRGPGSGQDMVLENGFRRAAPGEYRLKNAGECPVWIALRNRIVPEAPEAFTQGLEVHREYLDESGKPIAGRSLKVGELVQVRLRLRFHNPGVEVFVLCDMLPGCLEIEDEALRNGSRVFHAWERGRSGSPLERLENRFDRFLAFGDASYVGTGTESVVVYRARVVTPGDFAATPVSLESMYRPELRAQELPGESRIQAVP